MPKQNVEDNVGLKIASHIVDKSYEETAEQEKEWEFIRDCNGDGFHIWRAIIDKSDVVTSTSYLIQNEDRELIARIYKAYETKNNISSYNLNLMRYETYNSDNIKIFDMFMQSIFRPIHVGKMGTKRTDTLVFKKDSKVFAETLPWKKSYTKRGSLIKIDGQEYEISFVRFPKGWPIFYEIYGGYIKRMGKIIGSYSKGYSGTKTVFILPEDINFNHKLAIINSCIAGQYNGRWHGDKNVQNIIESEAKLKRASVYYAAVGITVLIFLIMIIIKVLFS